MHIKSRLLSAVLLTLIGIFLVGLIAPFFLGKVVKNRIENQVNRQIKGQGKIQIQNLQLHFWGQSVVADSVRFTFDNEDIPLKKILLKSAEVDGIRWRSFINRDIPLFGQLKLEQPYIELHSQDLSFSKFNSSRSSNNTSSSIRWSSFGLSIENGSLSIVHPQGDTLFTVDSFQIKAEEFTPGNVNRSMLDEMDINAHAISGRLKEQLYDFMIDEFNYSHTFHSAAFYNFKLIPMLPKYEFSRTRGKQIGRLLLYIPEIRLKGFFSDSVTTEIDSLLIKEAELEVFRNKKLERDPNEPNKLLLNDLASKIPFPFRLKTLQVNNSTVIYAEHRPPSDTLANVSFNRLNGRVKNFSSAAHPKFHQDTLTLHAETCFMDTSRLTVDVQYPLFREDERHILWAKLDSINPKAAGDMIRYVGFVEINSGMVHELEAEIILTDSTSTGSVTVIYSNLDFSLVNKNNPDVNGIKESVTNFITDNFIIQSENPAEDPRTGEINFEREKEKSIFAYWWKSLLSGIKSSLKKNE